MKIDSRWILTVALGLAIAFPATASAQGRGNANKSKYKEHEQRRVIVLEDDRREGDRDRDRDRIILRDGRRTVVLDGDDFVWFPVRSDRGPSFCRSGAGHPVFGLRWCLEKGFGIGRPGSVFIHDDEVFLRDRERVIVLRERGYDADRAFWSAVVGQVLAWVD